MLREPSIGESAKQRSLRVPLDHYERPDRLVRTKWLLTALAGAAALGYVGWLVFGGRAGWRHVSPGALAGAHAAWNDDCQACHHDFRPLSSDALTLTMLASGKADDREALDQACLKCHNEPSHHAATKPGEVPRCAACHAEHRGPAADIRRPADHQCLSCHRDIQQHRNGAEKVSPPIANVTGFGPAMLDGHSPHPEFRSLAGDPGNIKFNHWLHLQPGLAVSDAKHWLKLDDLEKKKQAKYSLYAKDGGLIQLDCAACHQPNSAGRYMQPIAYEQHCRDCHPLELSIDGLREPQEVPHGLTGGRLAALLEGIVFAAARAGSEFRSPSADESGEHPLVPGKTLGKNLAQKIDQDVLARTAKAAAATRLKCQECHYNQKAAVENVVEHIDVLPGGVPPVWLRHAGFDHASHRHIDCKQCHADAYAFEKHDTPQFITPQAGALAARDDEQVMIAGLETCGACHSERRGQQGGARHDCAECHDYHGGDALVGQSSSLPTSSFPGSSLGTHDPEAPASMAPPVALNINLAAFKTFATTKPGFLGASSCAASACHGSTRPAAPAWQTAFTKWIAADPHARAYDVLWTYRAREMTRLVSSERARTDEQRALSDDDHRLVINDHCIGCHATPLAGASPSSHASYALGVHCESCHGPAGDWLHAHDRTTFSRASATGFVDTKDLNQRAAACVSCHIGPSRATGQPQIVDHDLIAAGHPRLNFEFHSYIESLPAHWDRQADEARHGGEFHFRSWLGGQKAARQQITGLDALYDPRSSTLPDFARLDCFACHHHLTGDSTGQQPQPVPLKPVVWPPTIVPDVAIRELPVAQRLALSCTLLPQPDGTDAGWDAAVQSYLAVRAIAGDLTSERFPQAAGQVANLNAALARLGGFLSRDCFPGDLGRQPNAYDSPTLFLPRRLREHLEPVRDALQRLETALATAGAP